MTKSLAIIAAVVASTTFGGAALAAGDYYQGADKNASESHVDARHTASINNGRSINSGNRAVFAPADKANIGHGDYYEGANRPN
ncbi:hypothetical protein [Rhizobium sp. LCM 4573]|uniref:hypothetical protein n=1 Tax=Rhizobium sp. LCM 4573 TaxID=1848291 RepID=UPI0008DB020A|nr:hypothetical protein [Rhizobium sp. LCM 4573]OHV75693.1 hypothetical protein LCM4573_16315 [Rhizobium sp. LCM 4573]